MTRRDITQLFKRFFITFLCCVPIFLVVGFLLENKIQNWIMTVIFVVIGGGIFALEELIYSKRKQKRELLKEELKNNKEDYFKEEPKVEKNKKNQVSQNKKSGKSKNTTIDNHKNKSNKTKQASDKQNQASSEDIVKNIGDKPK